MPNRTRKRFEVLKDTFKSKFGEEPSFYARAPGRVNLIGKRSLSIWSETCTLWGGSTRRAYWLLRLLCAAHGHRTRHPHGRLDQQRRPDAFVKYVDGRVTRTFCCPWNERDYDYDGPKRLQGECERSENQQRQARMVPLLFMRLQRDLGEVRQREWRER